MPFTVPCGSILRSRITIVDSAFDLWRFGARVLDLSERWLRTAQFPQHGSRLVSATERRSPAVCAIPATVLDRHVATAVAKQTQRGALIAHAGGPHTLNQFDPVIALAMAVDRAENQPEIAWP